MAAKNYAGGALPRYLLLGSSVLLMLVGLVMVYSASSVSDYVTLGDSAYHMKRQALWVLVGTGLMVFFMKVDYRKLRSFSWPFLGVTLVGLVLVMAIGVGKWGAKRWIDLGFTTIQPSEYAKLACIMVAAYLLTQLKRREIGSTELWGRLFMSVGGVVLLVMAQPDMGTTVSIVLAVFVVLLLGGIQWSVLGGTLAAGAAVAAAAVMVAPYRAQRLFAFLDPWADPQGAGYQTIQAMLAFGSGGVDGVGLGMSRQKFFYLPAAHTDFVFAIIGEETGLVGTLLIVLAFGVFAYAGMRIAIGAKDHYGRLLAGGVTAMIVMQALMSMAAVTNLMPVTGIPMPLVSFGGSSMTFTLMCVGLILSVSTYGSRGVRNTARGSSKGSKRAYSDERRGNRRPHLSSIDGGRAARGRRGA